MNTQNDLFLKAGETFEYANQYFQREVALLKLEVAEKAAKSTSSVLTLVVIILLSTMVLLMLSISTGFWLGKLLNSNALAFLILAAIYLIGTIMVYFFKNEWITNPILTVMLKSLFEPKKD